MSVHGIKIRSFIISALRKQFSRSVFGKLLFSSNFAENLDE